MKFLVIVKANEDSERGVLPSSKALEEMMAFNQKLVDAGVMLAGEGLQPSSKGARVRFDGDKRIVTDGPFAETKELVAGFWIWQCKSLQEAIDWLKLCPCVDGDQGGEVEIRPMFSIEDFGDNASPELRAKEAEMRSKAAAY